MFFDLGVFLVVVSVVLMVLQAFGTRAAALVENRRVDPS
jgi:hypothetical protein